MESHTLECNSAQGESHNSIDRRGLIKSATVMGLVAAWGFAAGKPADAAELESNESAIGMVEVRGYRLRLVSTDTGFGIAANVYSFRDNRWLDAPKWVPTISSGKQAAEEQARLYLRAANLELPEVRWQAGDFRPTKELAR
jgi:hypothetical protein